MRHHVDGVKLGRTSSHKIAMFRNMVTSLILHDRIETTLPKAKELRRWADKMVTLAKKNTLHARRMAMTVLKDPAAMQKLFSTLVDRYKDRHGGYTRIMKLGHRHGDNAAMAIIEYLSAEAKKALKSEGKGSEEKKHSTKHAKKVSAHKTVKHDSSAKLGSDKRMKGTAHKQAVKKIRTDSK